MYIVNKTFYNLLSVIDNIKDFLSSLTAIDIIFFFAVLLLMILLVALLYFIKTNADYIEPDTSATNKNNSMIENSSNELNSYKLDDFNDYNINSENTKYSAQASNYNSGYNDEETELLDLETITKKLENKELAPIDLSAFEEEQERDAIISYDELLNRSNSFTNNVSNENIVTTNVASEPSYNIPYKNEIMLDDLLVKEVDIKGLENKVTNEVKTISYNEEEAFLDALKKLQQSLR